MLEINFTDSISEYSTENLFQWDNNQLLKISGVSFEVAPVVHFANKKSDKALVVQSTLNTVDSTLTVNIPNTLLEEKYDIIAYIYKYDGDSGQTIVIIHIPVTPRIQPDDYIFRR